MIHVHVNVLEVALFLALVLRIGLVLFLLPFFSGQQVPAMIKAGACFSISLLLYPSLKDVVQPVPLDMTGLVLVVVAELIIGMLLALSCVLILAAFQHAGEGISFQMGLGFAQVADPHTGNQVTMLSRWFNLLGLLLFFSLDGHHYLLRAIVGSFHTIPLGAGVLTPLNYERMIALSAEVFVIAVKLAAPVMVVILMLQFGLGLMGKFAPQMNILMTSFPLSIMLGLLFLGFSVMVVGDAMTQILGHMVRFIFALARLPS